MASEHGDDVSATRFLCALIRVMSEFEKKHQVVRDKWTNVLTHDHMSLLYNTVVADAVPIPIPVSVTAPPHPPPIAASLSHTSLTADTLKKLQAEGTGLVPIDAESNAFISPYKLKVVATVKDNASETSSVTNQSNRRNSTNTFNYPVNKLLLTQSAESNRRSLPLHRTISENSMRETMKALAVPILSRKLVSLVDKSQKVMKKMSVRTEAVVNNATELLLNKQMTTLRFNPDNNNNNSSHSLNNGETISSKSVHKESVVDHALLTDAFHSLGNILSPQAIPVPQQEDAIELLTVLTKKIIPSSSISLPVQLLFARPLRFKGECSGIYNCISLVLLTYTTSPTSLLYLQPVYSIGIDNPSLVTESVALSSARVNLEKVKKYNSESRSNKSDNNQMESVDQLKSSALFYDPFQAKRDRNKFVEKNLDVFWTSHRDCSVVVAFSNPLSVPLCLDNVQPVIPGCSHRVYPVAIDIPPQRNYFEVVLPIKPIEPGELKITGLLLYLNNAKHFIRVDETGLSSDNWYVMCIVR